MIAQSSGEFLIFPFGVGSLLVLTSAYGALRSAVRKDPAMALKSAGGLVGGSWLICVGLGAIPKAVMVPLSVCAFGTTIVLIEGGHFLVNRREALLGLASAALATLLVIGILGLHALGVIQGPVYHAGLLVIVFLVAFAVGFVRNRWGRGPRPGGPPGRAGGG